mmetsp:Transcript_8593/g.9838  ORF Transcript_8593/g.9838 Transcript_8593/m.9838 type:complete len:113 (+) Transcript_8593:74-412(+)
MFQRSFLFTALGAQKFSFRSPKSNFLALEQNCAKKLASHKRARPLCSSQTGKEGSLVKAAPIAKPFREETRSLIKDYGVSPRIVGFLANSDPAAYQYAHFTKKNARTRWNHI